MLRTSFQLPAGKVVQSSNLTIVGLGQSHATINGRVVSLDHQSPGWTAWASRVLYSTYAVDSLLTGGAINSLGVILSNSMYNVPAPPHGRYTKWVGVTGPRMVIAQLTVVFTDGSDMKVVTSGNQGGEWMATDGGPITFSHQYAGEDYNSTLEVGQWDTPAFNATLNPLVQWGPAQDCSSLAPKGTLLPSAFDPIQVMEVLPMVSSLPIPNKPGTLLVDFGKNFAGFPSITLTNLTRGGIVTIFPSETMEGGDIQQCSGGCPVYMTFMVPPGTLTATLAPKFFTYGFRWVTVSVQPLPSAAAPAVDGGGDAGTLVIHSATYGGNCNSNLAGDATTAVASFCGSTSTNCTYTVCVCGDNTCGAGTPPCFHDPASGCPKDLSVTYGCTGVPGSNYTFYVPAEANSVGLVLSCPAPPPPPPPQLPSLVSANGMFVRASVPTVGTWESSNPWVNQIYAITVEAVKANLQSVLTDCPHRERLGWLEVSHLMFPSIAYTFDISRLWAKISMDTVDSQLSSGMIPDIAPEYTVFSGGFRDSPEWGAAGIMNPAWLYQWYNDSATLSATYSTGQKYVAYLLSKVTPATGLLEYGLGDWIPVVGSPIGVTATATLVQVLQSMAVAAQALGRPPGEASAYLSAAEKAATAFHAAYFKGGEYVTQCAAGMGLLLNITPPADVPAAQAYLLNDVKQRGNVSTSGEIGNRYALMALGEIAGGEGVSTVWDTLLRNNSPGYGWMLVRGETALAESWDDSPGDSHIHAMYGHIAGWLYHYVAGIQPGVSGVGGGWGSVVISPALPCGREGALPPFHHKGCLRELEWVNATYLSPKGQITVLVQATAGGVRVRASIPRGVEGLLVVPGSLRRVPFVGNDNGGASGKVLDIEEALRH